MRMQHLYLLLSIAQTGSLRASAQELHVTQPALTKALQQLEDEFGTAMVLRMPKGVRLTPAGELLAARAGTMVRELKRAREEVAYHLHEAEAQVTVGLSPVATTLLAQGVVERFCARWPQVKLCMRDTLYPRALEQVRAGELDLAIGPLPMGSLGRDLLAQPLFESHVIIAARNRHPLARAEKLADLLNTNWVLTGPAGGPGDPCNLRFDHKGILKPKIQFECESFMVVLTLMPRLDVIGIVPKHFFNRYAPTVGLVEVPVTDALLDTTIHAFYRADAPLTRPAQRLLDTFMVEAAAQQTGASC